MEQKLVKAEQFGLAPEKATTIENEFAVVETEQSGLIEIYDRIIKSEITPELEEEARQLSTKLSKLNATNNRIHKSQKAYFLAGGKFVDALKNKNRDIISEMQDRLDEIKNYSKNLRLAEIAKLKAERINELQKLDSEIIPEGLGEMDASIWGNYYNGVKLAYDTRIEAERKAEAERLEAERKANLHHERKYKLSRLIDFIDNFEELDFGEMSEKDYQELVSKSIAKRSEYEAEQERIRLENEKLRKEAERKAKELEAKEKAAQAEKIRLAKIAEQKAAQLQAKIEAERREKEKLIKEAAEKEAKLKAEQEEAERLEAERLEAELNKGDAAKRQDLITDLLNIKQKYSFKSQKNKAMFSDVKFLIDKVINHINK